METANAGALADGDGIVWRVAADLVVLEDIDAANDAHFGGSGCCRRDLQSAGRPGEEADVFPNCGALSLILHLDSVKALHTAREIDPIVLGRRDPQFGLCVSRIKVLFLGPDKAESFADLIGVIGV